MACVCRFKKKKKTLKYQTICIFGKYLHYRHTVVQNDVFITSLCDLKLKIVAIYVKKTKLYQQLRFEWLAIILQMISYAI